MNYFVSFMLQHPISVGNVIHVERNSEPCEETVETIHRLYIKEIERMFSETKDQYGPAGYKLIID